MPQEYTVVHTISALAAARDLIEIAAPATCVVEIFGANVCQDSDDATSESEMLPILVQRASASGSGGSVNTPTKRETGFVAARSTVEGGNTAAATLTGQPFGRDTFNVLTGWLWQFPALVLAPSEIGVIRLDAAPTDAIDIKITVYFREIG
jgi:hypothetical protein